MNDTRLRENVSSTGYVRADALDVFCSSLVVLPLAGLFRVSHDYWRRLEFY